MTKRLGPRGWPSRPSTKRGAAGTLDRQDAEKLDQPARRGEAVDVDDEGGEDDRGDVADALDGIEMVGPGQRPIGLHQHFFQVFLACIGVAELADVIADQLLSQAAGQRGHRGAGLLQQRGDVALGQVGDVGQVAVGSGGEELGGGKAMDQFEHPAGGDVLDQQAQFGKGQVQQMMELIDEAGALADDGLEPAGDLAEDAQLQ